MYNEWSYKICTTVITLGELLEMPYETVFEKIEKLLEVNNREELLLLLNNQLIKNNKSTLFKNYDANMVSKIIGQSLELSNILILQSKCIDFVNRIRENNYLVDPITLNFAEEHNLLTIYALKAYIKNGFNNKIENILKAACRNDEESSMAAIILANLKPNMINLLIQQVEKSCDQYRDVAIEILRTKAENTIN